MQTRRPLINGKHRKQTNPLKGRVAFVAAATGVVSTAGATGAAIAHTTDTGISEISLAAEDTPNAEEGAPQILDIAEFKPVSNLQDQLNKAVQYSNDLAKADEEARKPKISVSRPTDGILTSGYGMRWGSLHAGVDLANAIGTPILAVMDGTVIDSGPASGYGNWIRIKHDDGSMSVYGHMETLDVKVGERVKAGQKIAGMGNRGFSTGPHLHFEIHPDGNAAVDPVPWFNEHGISLS